MAKLLCLLAT